MAFALTIGAQAQQDDGLADIMAAMIAAKVHQDSIDVSSLMAVYDYECRTLDAEGNTVTDRMKLCLLVGSHCKFLKERERAGESGSTEFQEGYDFVSPEEIPLLRLESYCHVPQVWTNYPDSKMTIRDAIPPTIYETQEERRPTEWTLSQGSATCELHGRKWTVRYDEDIPTTAGPWKLCGLPGLIVEAVSEDNIHHFTIQIQKARSTVRGSGMLYGDVIRGSRIAKEIPPK